MKRWLRSIVDIRKGEVLVTTLMTLNIYILLVTYYLLKPARDSLFIAVSGAKNLPLVFILIAIVVVPVTTIYSRVSRSLKLNQLINYTSVFIILNLFFLRWLISLESQTWWVVYAFYTWVSIYGALAPTQFWLLANALYDATQAKRIFVIFGLAAIIGATTGGEITNILLKDFGIATEDLLYFCVAFMGISIFLVTWVWSASKENVAEEAPNKKKSAQSEASMGEVFKDIKSSRYLLMIIGIIVMTMVTATFVDYLLKAVAEEAFTPAGAERPDKQELGAFFGKYYGRVSALSFLVQTFLSYRILKMFGVSGAILFLPVSQIFSAIGMALAPGLAMGVVLRGSGDVFKYSIDKTGRELLFLPVPLDIKKRVKVFIDVLVDRWFRGVAGGILYICTAVLLLNVSQISYLIIAIVGLWIFLALSIRKQYVAAFRSALDKGEIDPAQLTVKITDASTVKSLVNALDSTHPRQLSYALGMLREVQNDILLPKVQPLLKHENGEVRSKAVQVLQNQSSKAPTNEVQALLQDPDPDVRSEAMYYLYLDSDNGKSFLEKHLNSEDFHLQSATLGCLALYGNKDEKTLLTGDLINELINREDENSDVGRKLLARALGAMANPLYGEYLLKLLEDKTPEVVRETIAAIGKTRNREYLPSLLNLLADKRYRNDVRKALSQFGNRILGTLNDYLLDPDIDAALRQNVPRVLVHIPTQESVNTLAGSLLKLEPGIQRAAIHALSRLRNKNDDLEFDHKNIQKCLANTAASFYRNFKIFPSLADVDNNAVPRQLLKRALKEKLQKTKEDIFKLIALTYPSKDVHNAYLGVLSTNKTVRASGVEFLENLLPKEMKSFLIPILDESAVDDILFNGKKLYQIDINSHQEALAALVTNEDPWLQACAIYALTAAERESLQEPLEAAQKSRYSLVSEVTELVLKSSN